MFVTGATVQSQRGTQHDDQQHAAAVKIQASFRGARIRKARRGDNANHPRQRERDSAPGDGKLRIDFHYPGLPSEASRSRHSEAEGSRTGSALLYVDGTPLSQRGRLATASFCSVYTFEQVQELRSYLESQASSFPAAVQAVRIDLWMLLEVPQSSWLAQAVSVGILVCILLSISILVLETMPELEHISLKVWLIIEVICTSVFTVEFCIRICVCTVCGITVCDFLKMPMNVVDLTAMLPFYLSQTLTGMNMVKALGLMRVVRLVRLFRIFKLGRYSSGLQLMMIALRNSTQGAVVLCVFLGIGIIGFSSLVYYAERMACPDRRMLDAALAEDGSGRTALAHYLEECQSKDRKSRYGLCCNEYGAPIDFPTIVETFWWSIVTMTTVGFGDAVPKTAFGQWIGCVTMLCGILLLAMPIAIIGRKFQEAYNNRMESLGQSSKVEREEAPWPSLREMGQRMLLMRLPDHPEVGRLARELAEEFEEVAQVQEEILSMRKHEREQQVEVIKLFDGLLTRFLALSDQSAARVPSVKSPVREKKSKSVKQVSSPSMGLRRSDIGSGAGPVTNLPGIMPTSAVLEVNAVAPLRGDVPSSSRATGMVPTTSLPGAVDEDGFMNVVPIPPQPLVICDSCCASAAKNMLVAPMSLTASETLQAAAKTQMIPPVPPPSHTEVSFDGEWGKAKIDGRWLTFCNGDQAPLAFPRSETVQMFWQGSTYEGKMQNNGELHWDDGEVWMRRARTMPGKLSSAESVRPPVPP